MSTRVFLRSPSSWLLTIANGTWERRPGMTVAHGLARVETRTMEREGRGNLTAGYVSYFFVSSSTHGILSELG